jgi:DnaK suppressor protein
MSMSHDDLQSLRDALTARAKVLRGEISGKLGEAASDAGGMNTGGDFGDQSFASSESSLDLAEAGRDIAELQGIGAALAAINEGTYGYCVRCGDEIPLERLRAQPLALRCVSCQQRSERERAERPSTI